MTNIRVAILVVLAVVVAAAAWTRMLAQPAQAPASSTPAASAPAVPPSPPASTAPETTPTPSTTSTPSPPAAAAPTPSTDTLSTDTPVLPPPAAAQVPATSPAGASSAPTAPSPPTQASTPNSPPADPFGEEQTLTARKVVTLKGSAQWDNAFETLVASLKTLTGFLDKQGIKPAGPPLIVYTSTDDAGFTYLAEIPVDQEPKTLGKDMSLGASPEGKTLKFVHRGSYDNMDNTYEAITNHLDEQRLEAKDTFIEEYITDPLTTTEDKLVINVFVPLK